MKNYYSTMLAGNLGGQDRVTDNTLQARVVLAWRKISVASFASVSIEYKEPTYPNLATT